MQTITAASSTHIPVIQTLAEKIWWPSYSPILAADQIQFMLSRIYSVENLQQCMLNGEQFFLLSEDGKHVGFASHSPLSNDPKAWKINKLYVLTESHGKGFGKTLINSIAAQAKEKEIPTLVLNVNRSNPAVAFYQKIGFRIVREEDIAIGPYWMNDFVMQLDL